MPDEPDPKPTAAQVFSRQIEEIWLGDGTDQEKHFKCMALAEQFVEAQKQTHYRFPTNAEKMEGVD